MKLWLLVLFSSCFVWVSANNNNCKFAPGLWTCSGTSMQSEPGCLFWDQKWEISDFDGNNELTIIYKYLPECSCSCDNEVYCDGPCHDSICVWKATCSNGYISGAFSRGETCSNQDLTGFIDSDQNSIMFLFGDSTSQGSKEK